MKIIITKKLVEEFAELSTDKNPIHLDEDFAANTKFKKPIAHGVLIGSFISAYIAQKWPGCILTYLDFTFKKPVYIGDTIKLTYAVENTNNREVNIIVKVHASSILTVISRARIFLPKR